MRNLTGLWLLEKAIRQWQDQGKSVTISSLVNDAATVGPVRAAFDVSSRSWSPAKTSYTVRMQCASTDMTPPRLLLKSPAASCRARAHVPTHNRSLRAADGRAVEEVHMIGGGSLNPLLRRLTTDACGRPALRPGRGNVARQPGCSSSCSRRSVG